MTYPISYAPLALDTLANLDARIAGAFAKLAAELAADCMNRAGERGKRRLILTVDLVPEVDENGNCDQVKTSVNLRASKPVFKTREYGLLATNAGFKFNIGDPTSPHQRTIQVDDYEDREVNG